MKDYKKILFISETDTAKGPMASGAFESYLLNSEYEVDCKGLVVLFPEPINEKAEAVMISNGISPQDHMSSPLKEEDVTEDTMLIALERPQYETMLERFTNTENIFLLEELIGEPVEYGDLHGKELVDYGRCYEQIRRHMKLLAQTLMQ